MEENNGVDNFDHTVSPVLESQKKEWRTHKNNDFEFVFQYPKDWSIIDKLILDNGIIRGELKFYNTPNPNVDFNVDRKTSVISHRGFSKIQDKEQHTIRYYAGEDGSIVKIPNRNGIDIFRYHNQKQTGMDTSIGYIIFMTDRCNTTQRLELNFWEPQLNPVFEEILYTFDTQ